MYHLFTREIAGYVLYGLFLSAVLVVCQVQFTGKGQINVLQHNELNNAQVQMFLFIYFFTVFNVYTVYPNLLNLYRLEGFNSLWW